ncbi:unnamed protein product [Cylicocyclus nassatus]|uniref:Uncharacterized protein n=1 Tax=Cylicocyclus nassatus TaxID=53992 RepID=A0AA36GZF7_CYLNA|nr:unnamed protein product [Cylicocyclus nassatus]
MKFQLRGLLDNLFNVIGNLKVLRPGRMIFQSDDNTKVLEDYKALFVYDPFQVCSLSVMRADGYTKSMKSLRTPVDLLQSTTPLDKTSSVNNGNTHDQKLDTRPVLRNNTDRYWMLRKKEKTLLQLKNQSDVVWQMAKQNRSYIKCSMAL